MLLRISANTDKGNKQPKWIVYHNTYNRKEIKSFISIKNVVSNPDRIITYLGIYRALDGVL